MREKHYRVIVDGGLFNFLKIDESVKAARKWASRAFYGRSVSVTREIEYKLCARCQCAPCIYGRKRCK